MADRSSSELSDLEDFWDEKARASGADSLKAVCLDTAEENSCIDRVQHALARSAMDRIRRIRDLTGAAVLDYGCGIGRWVDFLRARGCRYTGVDLSSDMLAMARRRLPDAEFRKVDGRAIPYGDNSVDLIWSIAVVHHNPPERQEQMIAEFARALRDGGMLVLFEGVGRSHLSEPGIYYPRTRSGWTVLAERHHLCPVWSRGARYFIFRSLGEALRRSGGRGSTAASRQPALIRWAARLDGVLCPRLAGFLPPSLQRRAIMVFVKRATQRPIGHDRAARQEAA